MSLSDDTICQMFDGMRRATEQMTALMERANKALEFYESDQQWRGVDLGIFISNTQPTAPFNDTYITDSDSGYVVEMERTGQAAATLGEPKHQSSPYTTELLCVSDLSRIMEADRTKLKRAFFCAFDTTVIGGTGTGQDSATVLAILATIGSDRALMQSMYQNGQIAFFQPNYFRPMVKINNESVLYGNLGRAHVGGKANLGHLSIGLPNPWITEPDIHLGKIKSIAVYAQMAQWIAAQSKAQRYCCYAALEFLYGDTLNPGGLLK